MYERIDLPADSQIVGLRIRNDITDSENRELVDLIQQRTRRHGSKPATLSILRHPRKKAHEKRARCRLQSIVDFKALHKSFLKLGPNFRTNDITRLNMHYLSADWI